MCKKKLGHITEIASFASSESFMLEEISTNFFTYKFGTSDLNFTLCMGEDLDSYGIKKSHCLVAQSLRDGDCFSKSNGDINVFTATHSIIQFNGTRHGLRDGMLISAVFYDGISGNPELLLKLNTAETEEEQKEIIKNNIEIIGITYWGNQQEPKWAIITDESPYMYLMLFRPKQ